MAALAMQRAVEQDGDEPQWLQDRDRLLLLVADRPATVLQVRRSSSTRSDISCDCENELVHHLTFQEKAAGVCWAVKSRLC